MMLAPLVARLALGVALHAPLVSGDTSTVAALRQPVDTPRARPRIVEVSDWYARRLAVHRALSYTILPLFALQADAGARLYKHPVDAPAWVLPTHRATAAALGGVFLVNTVTGVWNLWDSRGVTDHRALRTTHALLMLASDAGFTYAGAVLSKPARDDLGKRREHRNVAIASMGLATVGGTIMWLWNR